MISEELKAIVEKFKEQGEMDFFEGASSSAIEAFENENNLKLPMRYKEWLQFSDGGELFLPAGIQLYGVEHSPIIDVTNDDRPSDEYTVIGSLSTGDPILCKKYVESIAIYNLETGGIEEDEVYPNFIAFLNDLYDLLGMGD